MIPIPDEAEATFFILALAIAAAVILRNAIRNLSDGDKKK